ncbi:hypothetical protein NK983_32910, partial [Salmonella enterica subsp. enterica serovar Typhimurium]|nr:hypothetical protein [Salmonella enterica subsp. enterica serovar Typhimurium]
PGPRATGAQRQPLRLNSPQRHLRITSDPLFFHKPESVTVSAQARQCAHSRITTVEVPMGKLALFLGGFLLLTILIGILGPIP